MFTPMEVGGIIPPVDIDHMVNYRSPFFSKQVRVFITGGSLPPEMIRNRNH